MGNRLIKESICTSEDLNKLSPSAEILFYRLITKADDYGCFYGNEAIIKSYCFPLKRDDEIPPALVKQWLQEIADAGIIYLYSAEDGKKYLQFVKWHIHQEIRTQKHKFPTFAEVCGELPQIETDCESLPQIETDSNSSEQTSANCCLNPIQSNPKRIQSKKNPNPNKNPIQKAAGQDFEKDELFDQFYDAYPKKTGYIKQAFLEYRKVVESGVPPDTLIKAVHDQFDGIGADEIQYLTSAERWLQNRGWTSSARKGGKNNGRRAGAGKPVSDKDSGKDEGAAESEHWFHYDG